MYSAISICMGKSDWLPEARDRDSAQTMLQTQTGHSSWISCPFGCQRSRYRDKIPTVNYCIRYPNSRESHQYSSSTSSQTDPWISRTQTDSGTDSRICRSDSRTASRICRTDSRICRSDSGTDSRICRSDSRTDSRICQTDSRICRSDSRTDSRICRTDSRICWAVSRARAMRSCLSWILFLQVIFIVAAKNEKVCKSQDIRNMVSNFKDLENCTVIEGSLQILLIDYANPSEYNHWSFPDLVEVTEYMLLYRVYGLKTLSQIFPNLSVIRGQKLFFNYALVAFEMPNMEELGLHGLTKIMRGAVRIEKNPHLCYIDTIDWSQITMVKPEDNFIIENKDIDECVNVCPRRKVSPDREESICHKMDIELANGDKRQQQLCWTGQHCQKVCPSVCGVASCYSTDGGASQCCHPGCLGGCTGPGDTNCIACVNIFYSGRCVQRCPPGTYEYRKRRCITETECRSINVHGRPWKLFKEFGTVNGKCVPECPSGYIESRHDINICEKCQGPCPKVCNGLMVDSVSAAQQIKGCTVINGVLEIQIRGGSQIGAELEENLGSIKEIMHYLSIVRSYAILSMHFLKNLEIIHGQQLSNDRHALVVINNQNLRDIWDFNTHPNLTIKRGNVFFHYNRKLCLHLIDELIHLSGINGTDENDVSRETNGDLIPCHTQELTLEVVAHLPTHAIIRWTNFFLNDHRELLGWVINLREAPYRNVTMYDSRDACGADEWKQEDIPPDSDETAHWMAHILYQLKPFTQYAVYVQTFTVAQAKKGAMSPIAYFMTDPDVPWPARDIEVTAVNQGELHVQWKPPLKPNGNVTHYYVYWVPQILSRKKLDQRNYCEDKLRLPGNKKETVIGKNDQKNATAPPGECCMCPKSEEQQVQEEDERLMQITFEDHLHDTVYIKRPLPDKNESIRAAQQQDHHRTARTVPSNEASKDPGPQGIPNPSEDIEQRRRRRRRRTTNGDNKEMLFDSQNSYSDMFVGFNMTNLTEVEIEEEEPVPYEVAIVHGKNEVLLPNLKHFQEYSIEVIACHDYIEGQKFKRCSNRALTTHRTLADESADTIDPRNISTSNGSNAGEVIIRWSDPQSPNGLVVTYEIELRRTDTRDYLPMSRCITHKKYWEIGGYLIDKVSPPGNWSFRIRATSLAGNGSWTPTMYFYVPQIESADGLNIQMIAGVAAFTALLVILVVAASIWLVAKKRFNPSIPDGVLYASVNPEYWSAADVYVPDEWEVSRDKIQLVRELGQGSFGMVYEGIAKDIVRDEPISKVAIKTVNEKATMRDRIEFLNEASVMKVFNCNHVVKLRGVVSKGQPTLVIMELMAQGDLKSFLRSLRPEDGDRKPPTLKEILQTAGEIADGMAYLAAKKFVHRDLAARNCMVSENMVVKIGDFGMTREIYETDYYRKGGKGLLPVRWMAPESLQDGLFTSQSDVWSYGVVLWEMATLAAQPYQGLANEQVLHFVIDKGIMEKPEGCPDKLYEIMQLCWNHSPKTRPTFCEIIELLVPDLNTNFHQVSYFFSEENQGGYVPSRDVDGEEELVDNVDDCSTPLTGSPYHTDNNTLPHTEYGEDQEDEEEMLHDTLSRDSSLSYNSHLASATPDSQGALMVVVDEKLPSQGWDLNTDNSGTTQKPTDDMWRPNHITWDGRRTPDPPSSQNNSNDGSKASSKSTESSHSGVNGFVNGQVPRYVTPPQHAQC